MKSTKVPVTKIANLHPSKLIATSFQPPRRTTQKAIAELLSEIRAEGILSPLHALENGVLIDGHRRKECATILGLKTVPVLYHAGSEKDLERLWSSINRGVSQIDGRDWMYMWLHSNQPCNLQSKYVPSSVMKKLRDCWEVFENRAGIQKLVDGDFAPFAGQRAKEVSRWLNSFDFARGNGKTTPQQLGAWGLRHGPKSFQGADHAYRAGLRLVRGGAGTGSRLASRLATAVKKDEPFTKQDLEVALGATSSSASMSGHLRVVK